MRVKIKKPNKTQKKTAGLVFFKEKPAFWPTLDLRSAGLINKLLMRMYEVYIVVILMICIGKTKLL